MFNVLISGSGTAWETDQLMRMEIARFKGPSDGIEAAAVTLEEPDTLKLLERISTLLMYEPNSDGPNPDIVRYGELRDIRVAGRELVFRFDERGRCPRSVVDEFSDRLGLHKFEQGRTHWAIKDGDIPTAMLAKIVLSDVPRQRIAPFISYAREDAEIAKRLYRDLKLAGAEPWLDSEELLGGQDWDATIRITIRDSTHFLALISEHSVNKQGYVQKELRHAMDILDEFPPNKIFAIPIRLDTSSPLHDRLRRLHQIDLFPEYEVGLRKILRSLGLLHAPAMPSAEAYRTLYAFARSFGGMNLKHVDIVEWCERWFKQYDFSDFGIFQDIYEFARSPSGLAMYPRDAVKWAEEWLSQSRQGRFAEFLKAFSTARTSLSMSASDAKNWAMTRIGGS